MQNIFYVDLCLLLFACQFTCLRYLCLVLKTIIIMLMFCNAKICLEFNEATNKLMSIILDNNYSFVFFYRDMIEMWNGYGVGVVTWTVNNTKAKDFFTECLDCPIITDCVRHDSKWN